LYSFSSSFAEVEEEEIDRDCVGASAVGECFGTAGYFSAGTRYILRNIISGKILS
jgi:hypothetical protein